MAARNRFGPAERAARSRLAQLLHDREFIRGSVVSMARTCGKAGCRCNQGEKHVSAYLSAKVAGKRRMVYIPDALQDEVRRCVETHREVERLAETVSGACLDRVLGKKRKGKADG